MGLVITPLTSTVLGSFEMFARSGGFEDTARVAGEKRARYVSR